MHAQQQQQQQQLPLNLTQNNSSSSKSTVGAAPRCYPDPLHANIRHQVCCSSQLYMQSVSSISQPLQLLLLLLLVLLRLCTARCMLQV
jgi:hypothetical protein